MLLSYLEGVKKTTKPLSPDCRPQGQDLNVGPPEHEAVSRNANHSAAMLGLAGDFHPSCNNTLNEWRGCCHDSLKPKQLDPASCLAGLLCTEPDVFLSLAFAYRSPYRTIFQTEVATLN
jgi:hypothetical protein